MESLLQSTTVSPPNPGPHGDEYARMIYLGYDVFCQPIIIIICLPRSVSSRLTMTLQLQEILEAQVAATVSG